MGKYEKKRARKSRKGLVAAIVVVIAAILSALFVMPRVLHRLSVDGDVAETPAVSTAEPQNTEAAGETTAPESEPQPTEPAAQEPAPQEPAAQESEHQSSAGDALEFPYVLEDGTLEIESLFRFDGINPDCGNKEGKNIATIAITNRSDTYLESAALSVVTDRGETLNFKVTDLPAGETALVFSPENQELPSDAVCSDIRIDAAFAESNKDDRLSAAVDGMSIVVENTAGTDIHNIVVYYRDVFNENYFGGVAYSFEIEKLSAGESTAVTAEESLLGVIEVVRIAVNQEN